ncbi:Fanconi Anemia Group J Protein [Manis pentadactyla]|nr:Fanconi Anemia Group J Protein [Manis pentadactyla]
MPQRSYAWTFSVSTNHDLCHTMMIKINLDFKLTSEEDPKSSNNISFNVCHATKVNLKLNSIAIALTSVSDRTLNVTLCSC